MKQNKIDEMLNIFKDEFSADTPIIQTWIHYEVLAQEIEYAIDNTPNDTLLGGKIRQIMSNWSKQNQDIPKAPKKRKNKKESSYPTIELLNSEGPILWLKRTPESFLMYDEDKFMIGKFSVNTLTKFIDGISNVIDSRGRVWNYPTSHEAMKPNPEDLKEFVNFLK